MTLVYRLFPIYEAMGNARNECLAILNKANEIGDDEMVDKAIVVSTYINQTFNALQELEDVLNER